MCQNKFRFERRSPLNDQILTIDARRRATVIVIRVTVPANISRVTDTLVGIHSIDTTTLEEGEMNALFIFNPYKEVESNFSQDRVRGGTSRKIIIPVFRVELPYSELGNVG